MNELIERLAREAGCGHSVIDCNPPVYYYHFQEFDLERFAALVAAECARLCDDEQCVRTEAGRTHPEESPSRDRCYAGARAAINCALAIRAAFPMPKG